VFSEQPSIAAAVLTLFDSAWREAVLHGSDHIMSCLRRCEYASVVLSCAHVHDGVHLHLL
jgi:hypothetical protein